MEKLVESILSAVLDSVEITKALNGGFAIQSISTTESSMCQYQTWETEEINLYLDKNGTIVDGDYGVENISQPSCKELESSYQYKFGSKGFENWLNKNLEDNKEKEELNKVISGLVSILTDMKPHDVIKFNYRYFTDEVSEFEFKPFIKKEEA